MKSVRVRKRKTELEVNNIFHRKGGREHKWVIRLQGKLDSFPGREGAWCVTKPAHTSRFRRYSEHVFTTRDKQLIQVHVSSDKLPLKLI